jgi:hypothetical protein
MPLRSPPTYHRDRTRSESAKAATRARRLARKHGRRAGWPLLTGEAR